MALIDPIPLEKEITPRFRQWRKTKTFIVVIEDDNDEYEPEVLVGETFDQYSDRILADPAVKLRLIKEKERRCLRLDTELDLLFGEYPRGCPDIDTLTKQLEYVRNTPLLSEAYHKQLK